MKTRRVLRSVAVAIRGRQAQGQPWKTLRGCRPRPRVNGDEQGTGRARLPVWSIAGGGRVVVVAVSRSWSISRWVWVVEVVVVNMVGGLTWWWSTWHGRRGGWSSTWCDRVARSTRRGCGRRRDVRGRGCGPCDTRGGGGRCRRRTRNVVEVVVVGATHEEVVVVH